jgi:hypothetical protein
LWNFFSPNFPSSLHFAVPVIMQGREEKRREKRRQERREKMREEMFASAARGRVVLSAMLPMGCFTLETLRLDRLIVAGTVADQVCVMIWA